MIPNQKLLVRLLAKYAKREALSERERHVLESWLSESEEHRILADFFRDAESVRARLEMDPERSEKIWSEINQSPTAADEVVTYTVPSVWRFLKRLAIAVLIGFGIVAAYLYRRSSTTEPAQASVKIISVAVHHPEDSTVVLTRLDSSRVDMDSVAVGAVVEKNVHGVLRKIARYTIRFDAGADSNSRMADLTVGIGHLPYTVYMPDSSQLCISGGVQLSMIFNRQSRSIRVEGKGKATCDIAKHAHWPCRVGVPNGASIDVLGTVFQVEVSATKPETRVVLLTGKVKVVSGRGIVLLTKPLQAALVYMGRSQLREGVDTVGFDDWKKDAIYFHFRNAGLKEALQQVASWYGCNLVYHDKVPTRVLDGRMFKTASLDDILTNIREAERPLADVQREGNSIVVSPYPTK